MKHFVFQLTIILSLLGLFSINGLSQTTVVLEAEKDNSIYSENDNSNGSGISLFAGRTNSAALRRALVKFDITSIPANATITEARLSITGSRQSSNSISAHRLNGDWGESTSNASGQEGQGASPAADDATWNFQFFSTNA